MYVNIILNTARMCNYQFCDISSYTSINVLADRCLWIVDFIGVASNRQEEAIASSWILQNKKTTRLISCLVCRKPRGGRSGYDSDQSRKFWFPYLTNTTNTSHTGRHIYFTHKFNKLAMLYHNTTCSTLLF